MPAGIVQALGLGDANQVRQRIAENHIMRHRRNARGFRAVAAALVLMNMTGPAFSPASASVPGDPIRTVKVGAVAFELVRIPAGTFLMGGTDQDWQGEENVDWRQATRDQSDDHPADSRSVFPLFGVPRLRGLDWSFPPEGGTPNKINPAGCLSGGASFSDRPSR
jgi:hypothetical protein